MKFRDGVYVGLLAVAIGIILWLSKCQPEKECQPEVITKPVLHLRDSIIYVPGEQIPIEVEVQIPYEDTSAIDSLLELAEDQQFYWRRVVLHLRDLIDERDSQIDSLEVVLREYRVQDSVTTDDYRLAWMIQSHGPINEFTYELDVFQPPAQIDYQYYRHRLGLYAGGQIQSGTIRQYYAAEYTFGRVSVLGGWLPKTQTSGSAFQVAGGISIPFKK